MQILPFKTLNVQLQRIDYEGPYLRRFLEYANYMETGQRAHDSQIVKAKENLKLSHGGPSQRQASVTNQRVRAVIASEASPTVVQIEFITRYADLGYYSYYI